jgi:hypothetical protein
MKKRRKSWRQLKSWRDERKELCDSPVPDQELDGSGREMGAWCRSKGTFPLNSPISLQKKEKRLLSTPNAPMPFFFL